MTKRVIMNSILACTSSDMSVTALENSRSSGCFNA